MRIAPFSSLLALQCYVATMVFSGTTTALAMLAVASAVVLAWFAVQDFSTINFVVEHYVLHKLKGRTYQIQKGNVHGHCRAKMYKRGTISSVKGKYKNRNAVQVE